jgi:hypothetical protein
VRPATPSMETEVFCERQVEGRTRPFLLAL